MLLVVQFIAHLVSIPLLKVEVLTMSNKGLLSFLTYCCTSASHVVPLLIVIPMDILFSNFKTKV